VHLYDLADGPGNGRRRWHQQRQHYYRRWVQLECDERSGMGHDLQWNRPVWFGEYQFHCCRKYDDERTIGNADDCRPKLRGHRTKCILHVLGHAVSRHSPGWGHDRDIYRDDAGRLCVVIVDDWLMGNADDGERNRIRDWQLLRASESRNAFAVGDYQRGWRADQSASERADIPDRNAGVSVKPQSDHQEVATRQVYHPGRSTTFETRTL
jgi:hypothetical protein